jgi:hypothetical protein
MKRLVLLSGSLGLLASAWVTAFAITRINGNQLLEGTGEYGYSALSSRGGEVGAPRLIYSLGQGVMAHGELPDSVTGPRQALSIGFGLGYDIAHYLVCPVDLTGDLSGDGAITAADLIQLCRFIYSNGTPPAVCLAVGDVNCSGQLTTSDCVTLVNYIFKSGSPPCNVCSLIPDTWPCP